MSNKLTLPLINVTIALGLVLAGHFWHRSSGQEPEYWAPTVRLAHAVNAPAMLFRFPVLRLWDAVYSTAADPTNSVEEVADDSIFLLGVAILWYMIGRKLEARKQSQSSVQVRPSKWAYGVSFVSFAAGIFLVLTGVGMLRLHLQLRAETMAESALYVIWGLVIAVIYGRDLLNVLSHPVTLHGLE